MNASKLLGVMNVVLTKTPVSDPNTWKQSAGSDGLAKMATLIVDLVASAKPIIVALSFLAIFIVGALFLYPSENTRRTAKTARPYVIIGIVLGNGAMYFATWISGNLTF